MNIVYKLTLRHLKENKRRTLVTILGVIISVAMITAVTTLAVSFLDLMKRQTIANEGEWHVLYKDLNKDQVAAIKNDEATKKLVISRDRGYALLEGGRNESKPYLFIKEYNLEGFKQFPIELSKGRLPQAANEVVISEHIATNAQVEFGIGDQLTLDVGVRSSDEDDDTSLDQNASIEFEDGKISETLKNTKTRNYTIVGFIKRPTWEPTWAPGYTIISYLDENIIGANDRVNATVILKKVKKSLFSHAENLADKNGIATIKYNDQLLRYYGVTKNEALNKTLNSLSAIIMTVIIIGSVSLIYNAFAISVSERSRHLGMLASVGATKRQKRNSVFFEGMIIGLVSIPLGIICGLIGIGITFYFINSMIQGALGVSEKLIVTVTPFSIIVACVISILTIFISTLLPAMKASKISAIDAIRQTTEIKLTRKAVKTSKLIRTLFGIEAEIGLKNLKRNKRRYKATIFSLVISIVLFLTVSFFTANLKKSLELSQVGVNFDIEVANGSEHVLDDELIHSIADLNDVTEYSVVNEFFLNTWVEEASVAAELKKLGMYKANLKDGKYDYYVRLSSLNDESLKEYAVAVGADYETLKNPNHLSAIVIDTIPYQDMGTGKFVETKALNIKKGKSLDLVNRDWEREKEKEKDTYFNKVEVVTLTDQFPMGIMPAGIGGLNIIVSEQVMDNLLGESAKNEINSFLFLKSTDPMKTQQEIEEMKDYKLYVHNVYQYRKQEEQMITIMSVFTYGFIVLITAISIANIFNTISTSISLRKREFAMLKSVGMTPKGFNKMINYESMFYGIQSLLFGLPISVVVMYLIYKSLMHSFRFGFAFPWLSILYVIAAVFVIVSSAMLYSSAKVKKENIIDALKQESI
ncbi:ABC transporter permease [Cytobacillus depressus]|uniref:ABC transporter permease n=1 Tax=Cytobacillus depressus TaxID=1602942 RepID=A0A6L3UZB9_9BACI|nr:ABC transporter permease [Cytobacillus depressus]KAB2329766.1 ABC transporter permease [Cytobacillus depressus]